MSAPARHIAVPVSGVVWIRRARVLHRIVGLMLAFVLATLSITGGFVALKERVEYLQPRSRSGGNTSIDSFLPPAALARKVLALNLPDARTLKDIDRLEVRPGKRMVKVRLRTVSPWSPPRELQLDAATGDLLHSGVRGDQLWLDLHSYAVFGDGVKAAMMVLAALSVLWLILSGVQLYAYPLAARRRKAARLAAADAR